MSDVNNDGLKQLGIDWGYIMVVSIGMVVIFGLCAIGYFKCYGDESPKLIIVVVVNIFLFDFVIFNFS